MSIEVFMGLKYSLPSYYRGNTPKLSTQQATVNIPDSQACTQIPKIGAKFSSNLTDIAIFLKYVKQSERSDG